MDPQTIIRQLDLKPHPEGGFYRETYRCDEAIAPVGLPARYTTPRSFSTAIYYLLTPDSFSAMHRVQSDEVFHFYAGDPVTLLRLHPDGHADTLILGQDFAAGQQPQAVVPRAVWQGLRLVDGGRFALLGATVAPGFDFADFEMGSRDSLTRRYPTSSALITRLTRD